MYEQRSVSTLGFLEQQRNKSRECTALILLGSHWRCADEKILFTGDKADSYVCVGMCSMLTHWLLVYISSSLFRVLNCKVGLPHMPRWFPLSKHVSFPRESCLGVCAQRRVSCLDFMPALPMLETGRLGTHIRDFLPEGSPWRPTPQSGHITCTTD